MAEILVHVEGRTVIVDIEPNTVQGLRDEFDALCQEDEVLKERRRLFAPTFHSAHDSKAEIKRRTTFQNGDQVYIAWAPIHMSQSLSETVNNVNTGCDNSTPSIAQIAESKTSYTQLCSAVPLEPIQVTMCSIKASSAKISKSNQSNKSTIGQGADEENSLAPDFIDSNPPPQENPSALKQSDPSKTSPSNILKQVTQNSIRHNSLTYIDSKPGCSRTAQEERINSSEAESDDSHDDDWYGEVKEYYLENEWKKMPKALKRREKNRFELHDRQMKLGLRSTPFQPQKGEALQATNPQTKKKNRSSSIEPPLAKRSSKRIRNKIPSPESSEEVDDPPIKAGPSGSSKAKNTENSESSDDQNLEQGSSGKKKRRPNTKVKFLPGDELTGSKLLPHFGDCAVNSIKAGKPNMTFILGDIRNHILSKRRVLYLSKSERDNMSKAIVKKYPQLADVDGDKTGCTRLSKSISASIRGKRNYDANTRPRREAAKLQSKAAQDFKIVCSEDASEEDAMNAELRAGTADQVRVKFLIGRTLEIREVEFEVAYKASDPETKAQKCQEIWESYPHYKDGKLIIYEHCLHVKIKQEVMRDNFKNMVAQLSTLFEMSSESGPDILRILGNLYEEITPKLLISIDKKITPPIEIRDEGEAEGRLHIKTYHVGHAPCVLATTLIDELGNEVLSRSYLKIYNTSLGTIEDPTPCEVVLQLLAPYFIGNISFPDAYKSFLRFLERSVHGTLCCATSRQSAHSTYTNFVRRYESIK